MLTPEQATQAAAAVYRYNRCDLDLKDHERKVRKFYHQRQTIFDELLAMLLDWDVEFADSQTIESACIEANYKVNTYMRKAIDRAVTAAVAIKEERAKKSTVAANPRVKVIQTQARKQGPKKAQPGSPKKEPKRKQADIKAAIEVEEVRQTAGDDFAAQKVAEQIREKFREVFDIIETNSDFTSLDKASVIWQEMVVERKVELRKGRTKTV